MKCPHCHKYIPIRSNKQNNFYWAYLTNLSEITGDDVNSLHGYFKKKYLKPRQAQVMGQSITIEPTTTDLNVGEMNEYIKRIEVETGIVFV